MVRETFITYQRQKNAQFGLKDSQTKDVDALISSTLAGATTGGLLSAVFRKFYSSFCHIRSINRTSRWTKDSTFWCNHVWGDLLRSSDDIHSRQ